MTKSAIGFLLALMAGLSSSHMPPVVSPGAGPRSVVPDIPRLVSQAHAIFKGEVRQTRQVGTLEYTLHSGESAAIKVMSAQVRVDAALKGPVPSADEVSLIWYVRDVPDGFGALREGAYGLFFVSHSAAGYVVADPGEPYIPASRRPVSSDARRSQPLAAVEAELVNSLEDPDVGLACLAAMSLSVLPRAPVTLEALRGAALNHPDPRCRGQAVATLLASGDPVAVSLAVELLRGEFSLENVESLRSADQSAHSFYIATALNPVHTRSNLVGRLGMVIQDKDQLSYALELLRFPDAEAREQGLHGLRHIGPSVGTTGTLAEVVRLLDDPDLSVRWQAVLALVELTATYDAGWYPPTREAFNAAPDTYTDLWKQSWEKQAAHGTP